MEPDELRGHRADENMSYQGGNDREGGGEIFETDRDVYMGSGFAAPGNPSYNNFFDEGQAYQGTSSSDEYIDDYYAASVSYPKRPAPQNQPT